MVKKYRNKNKSLINKASSKRILPPAMVRRLRRSPAKQTLHHGEIKKPGSSKRERDGQKKLTVPLPKHKVPPWPLRLSWSFYFVL